MGSSAHIQLGAGVPGAGMLHPCYRGEGRVKGHSCQEAGRLGGGG